jgi:hypothetical protein
MDPKELLAGYQDLTEKTDQLHAQLVTYWKTQIGPIWENFQKDFSKLLGDVWGDCGPYLSDKVECIEVDSDSVYVQTMHRRYGDSTSRRFPRTVFESPEAFKEWVFGPFKDELERAQAAKLETYDKNQYDEYLRLKARYEK